MSRQETPTNPEIARRRLRSQRIGESAFRRPEEVVRWLVAVQAQDYAGAKWSLALRMRAARDRAIDRAFNEGSILRTHLLRPTWHFVVADDIRWLLALTAPRVHAASAHMYRKLELDAAVFKRSNAALAKALQGGRHLTRNELEGVLQKVGIATDIGNRMAYLMMFAELDGLICSGPRRGKQFTYALLHERAPQARTMEREESLAELSRRYFSSRGPATVQDFAKWSGLTVAGAGRGLAAVQDGLRSQVLDGQLYWLPKSSTLDDDGAPMAHLLSIYDEYISSYRDRSAILSKEDGARLWGQGNALAYVIVLDGRIVGTWKRTIKKDSVAIETHPFRRLTPVEKRAVAEGAERYGDFHELPTSLE